MDMQSLQITIPVTVARYVNHCTMAMLCIRSHLNVCPGEQVYKSLFSMASIPVHLKYSRSGQKCARNTATGDLRATCSPYPDHAMPDAYSVFQLKGDQVLGLGTEGSSKNTGVWVGAHTDLQGEQDHLGLKWSLCMSQSSANFRVTLGDRAVQGPLPLLSGKMSASTR